MKNSVIVLALALSLVACNSRSGQLNDIKEARAAAAEKARAERIAKGHNVYVRFAGRDSEIPKDGQLMVVKCSLEDTVIVDVATLDDARRVLEENGKG